MDFSPRSLQYSILTAKSMEKAQKAVDSVVDGVKKVTMGEKKQKPKKDKPVDSGADSVSVLPFSAPFAMNRFLISIPCIRVPWN